MNALSRRDFIRRTGAYSLLGTGAPLALNLAGIGNAAAAGASDYKALICVYMTGGNDAYNTVLATDSTSWSSYAFERGSGGTDTVALRPVGIPPSRGSGVAFSDQLGGVLPITPKRAQERTFALHPSMGGVRDLFQRGRLAVVSNVGPLLQPTTKDAYKGGTVPKPPRLFSHNDQQSTWQSSAVEGAGSGWGGRTVERLLANNVNSMFSSISVAGSAVWVNGETLRPYQLARTGVIRIGGGDTGLLFNSSTAQRQLVNVMSQSRTTGYLASDHSAMAARSETAGGILSAYMPAAAIGPWGTPGVSDSTLDPLLQFFDPDTGGMLFNSLAAQLQTALRMIAARGDLSMSRQVFFVNLGGFDTHNGQARAHATLVAKLSHAFAYLDTALGAMGLSESVTAFTASDFGRSFTSNGDGTDHGWGGHHLVLGGAVKGGEIYGTFPVYGVSDGAGNFSSNDQLTSGVLLPSTSVDQYGATLAQWFGLSATDATDVFPNLDNFTSHNLGFMT